MTANAQHQTNQPPQFGLSSSDALIDHAAGLFAKQRLGGKSLEPDIFATASPGTGLLNQVLSEPVLMEAAMEVCGQKVDEILARVADLRPGHERDLAIAECATDFALTWPGVFALAASMVDSQVPEAEMQRQGLSLLSALGLDPVNSDPVRLTNVLWAFAGLHATSGHFIGTEDPSHWFDLMVATTMRTLGHLEADRALAMTSSADAQIRRVS